MKFVLGFFYLTLLLAFSAEPLLSKSAYVNDNLFNMSLEDLMNVKVVSSSFTGVDKIKEPASVTVITADDIAVTPARNLYDLLEIYVPGAIWMMHYDSPHVGIRGIINQRNDKILLLLNGKNMAFKARNGATSELENWDMSDIERIEVIRGPGSVIFGPGAVEAVINITTKSYKESKGYKASLQTYSPYRSYGGNVSINQIITEDVSLFAFASVTTTKGLYPEEGLITTNNHSIWDLALGRDAYPEDRPLQDFLVDSDGKPQMKAHLQFNIGDNTTLWLRYTNSGSTYNGLTTKASYQTGFDSLGWFTLTKPMNFRWMENEQFVVAINNEWDIDPTMNLKSFICFDSENNSRRHDYIQVRIDPERYPQEPDYPDYMVGMLADPNSLRNQYFAASESEFLGRFLLNKKFSDEFTAAIGTEYSYNFWGSSWFKDEDYFRLGDRWNIVTSKQSPAYGYPEFFGTDTNDTYFVGNGWGTSTISFFGEANYVPDPNLTLLLSGRIDKDDYSNWLFSPRIASILSIGEYSYLKLIIQRSLRMNTAEELFIQNREGTKSQEESLDNIELIFTRLEGTDFIFNLSAFASSMKVLTWLDPIRSTIMSGHLKLYGIELETRYHDNYFDVIFNHAFTKQIKWELSHGVNESGVSYSDYYKELVGSEMNGIGNDLNNWSNHVTKLAVNFKMFEGKLNLHLNSRLYWNFQGGKDGITLIRQAAVGNRDSALFINIANIFDKYDLYGPDFRLNFSATYSPAQSLSITFYAMNIIDLTHNRRLRYDTGSKIQTETNPGYINKTSMLIEPLTIGVKLTFQF